MAHKADMVCGTRTDATQHARPRGRALQAHTAPRWHVAGANDWQGHTGPRGHPGGRHVATWRLAFEGPMG